MKNFKVFLVLAGVCLGSLAIGFSLGQFASDAASQGIQIETGSMQVSIIFSSGASDLVKDIGTTSLRFYAEVLNACLSEPENMEKILSTKVLTDFIFGSCLVNAARPWLKNREKNSEEKESGPRRSL